MKKNTTLPPLEIDSRFPNDEHYEELKSKGSHGRISRGDKLCWHAYDYGWRRGVLLAGDDISPIDPGRKRFNARLVAEAMGYWSRNYGGSKPAVESWRMRVAAAYRWTMQRGQPMPPGIPESDPRVKDLVERFEQAGEDEFADQNRLLAAARARIIGDGKNPDGTHSAETIAYVELCCRIIRANLRTFVERSQFIKRMPDGSPMPNADSAKDDLSEQELDDLRKKLGVKATEQKRRGFE
jgi:hypothetical protein